MGTLAHLCIGHPRHKIPECDDPATQKWLYQKEQT